MKNFKITSQVVEVLLKAGRPVSAEFLRHVIFLSDLVHCHYFGVPIAEQDYWFSSLGPRFLSWEVDLIQLEEDRCIQRIPESDGIAAPASSAVYGIVEENLAWCRKERMYLGCTEMWVVSDIVKTFKDNEAALYKLAEDIWPETIGLFKDASAKDIYKVGAEMNDDGNLFNQKINELLQVNGLLSKPIVADGAATMDLTQELYERIKNPRKDCYPKKIQDHLERLREAIKKKLPEAEPYMSLEQHIPFDEGDYPGFSDLIMSIFTGDIDLVEEALIISREFGFGSNAGGYTGAQIAAFFGESDLIDYFLARYKNTDERREYLAWKNIYGCNALHKAVLSNKSDIVKELISRQIGVNGRGQSGHTALHNCAKVMDLDLEIPRMLLEQGAEITTTNKLYTPFAFSVFNGNFGLLDLLMQHFTDKKDGFLRDRVECGLNLLHIAAKRGQLGMVKILIEEYGLGCLAGQPDDFEKLPISYAIDNGHEPIIEYLMEFHKDSNIIFDRRLIEDYRERKSNPVEAAEKLASFKNLPDKISVFFSGIQQKCLAFVTAVLDMGIFKDVLPRDARGRTPLHVCGEFNPDIQLVDKFISIYGSMGILNTRDRLGYDSPIHIGIRYHMPDFVLHLLKNHQANVVVLNLKHKAPTTTVLEIPPGNGLMPTSVTGFALSQSGIS